MGLAVCRAVQGKTVLRAGVFSCLLLFSNFSWGVNSKIGGVTDPFPLFIYGEGQTMIADFSFLPKSLKKKIDEIKKKKKYGTHDFTKSLGEITKALSFENAQNVDFEGNIANFKYTQAKIRYSKTNEDKGGCHDYPDFYLSLDSSDIKPQGPDHLIVPGYIEVITKKNPLPALVRTAAMKLVQNHPANHGQEASIWQSFLNKKDGTYVIAFSQVGMGSGATLVHCTSQGKCTEKESIEVPPCGS